MKKFLSLLLATSALVLLPMSAHAAEDSENEVDETTVVVHDEDSILNKTDVEKLENAAADLRKYYGIDFVVQIESHMSGDIEEKSLKKAEQFEVGFQDDAGIFIVFDIEDSQYFIATTTEITDKIGDEKISEIAEQWLIPGLENEDYVDSSINAANAIATAFAGREITKESNEQLQAISLLSVAGLGVALAVSPIIVYKFKDRSKKVIS